MHLRFTLLLAVCIAAAACGHEGAGVIGSHPIAPTANLKTPSPNLYVSDTANNAVDVFHASDSGDVAPSSVISGPDTMLASPHGVAVASDGTVFVANDTGRGLITVFAPGSSGDAVPERTLSCGGLARPAGISLDAAGNLYVANFGGNSISVFAPTDSGCVSGNRVIVGLHTCLAYPRDVDVRDDGTAYVASSSAVLVYAPGANGDATPIQKITGPSTQLLAHVTGVSLDSAFDIYVTSRSAHKHGRVTVYAPSATGDAAPLSMLAGPATTLDVVDKVELDPSDQIFVTNDSAVDVFAAGATGNAAPSAAIAGPTTTLAVPSGLDIQP
jgi:NHL repeat-containing protein